MTGWSERQHDRSAPMAAGHQGKGLGGGVHPLPPRGGDSGRVKAQQRVRSM
jgi:hypothetical protein